MAQHRGRGRGGGIAGHNNPQARGPQGGHVNNQGNGNHNNIIGNHNNQRNNNNRGNALPAPLRQANNNIARIAVNHMQDNGTADHVVAMVKFCTKYNLLIPESVDRNTAVLPNVFNRENGHNLEPNNRWILPVDVTLTKDQLMILQRFYSGLHLFYCSLKPGHSLHAILRSTRKGDKMLAARWPYAGKAIPTNTVCFDESGSEYLGMKMPGMHFCGPVVTDKDCMRFGNDFNGDRLHCTRCNHTLDEFLDANTVGTNLFGNPNYNCCQIMYHDNNGNLVERPHNVRYQYNPINCYNYSAAPNANPFDYAQKKVAIMSHNLYYYSDEQIARLVQFFDQVIVIVHRFEANFTPVSANYETQVNDKSHGWYWGEAEWIRYKDGAPWVNNRPVADANGDMIWMRVADDAALYMHRPLDWLWEGVEYFENNGVRRYARKTVQVNGVNVTFTWHQIAQNKTEDDSKQEDAGQIYSGTFVLTKTNLNNKPTVMSPFTSRGKTPVVIESKPQFMERMLQKLIYDMRDAHVGVRYNRNYKNLLKQWLGDYEVINCNKIALNEKEKMAILDTAQATVRNDNYEKATTFSALTNIPDGFIANKILANEPDALTPEVRSRYRSMKLNAWITWLQFRAAKYGRDAANYVMENPYRAALWFGVASLATYYFVPYIIRRTGVAVSKAHKRTVDWLYMATEPVTSRVASARDWCRDSIVGAYTNVIDTFMALAADDDVVDIEGTKPCGLGLAAADDPTGGWGKYIKDCVSSAWDTTKDKADGAYNTTTGDVAKAADKAARGVYHVGKSMTKSVVRGAKKAYESTPKDAVESIKDGSRNLAGNAARVTVRTAIKVTKAVQNLPSTSPKDVVQGTRGIVGTVYDNIPSLGDIKNAGTAAGNAAASAASKAGNYIVDSTPECVSNLVGKPALVDIYDGSIKDSWLNEFVNIAGNTVTNVLEGDEETWTDLVVNLGTQGSDVIRSGFELVPTIVGSAASVFVDTVQQLPSWVGLTRQDAFNEAFCPLPPPRARA